MGEMVGCDDKRVMPMLPIKRECLGTQWFCLLDALILSSAASEPDAASCMRWR